MSQISNCGLVLCAVLAAGDVAAQISGGVAVDPTREAQPVSSSLGMWVGQIKVLNGLAHIDRDARRYNVVLGMQIKENDVLTTVLGGSVGVLFNDNSTISIGPNTQIVIHRFAFDTTTHQGYLDARIHRGTAAVQPGHIAQNAPEAMRISTPAAVLRSRAAAYVVSVKGDGND